MGFPITFRRTHKQHWKDQAILGPDGQLYAHLRNKKRSDGVHWRGPDGEAWIRDEKHFVESHFLKRLEREQMRKDGKALPPMKVCKASRLSTKQLVERIDSGSYGEEKTVRELKALRDQGQAVPAMYNNVLDTIFKRRPELLEFWEGKKDLPEENAFQPFDEYYFIDEDGNVVEDWDERKRRYRTPRPSKPDPEQIEELTEPERPDIPRRSSLDQAAPFRPPISSPLANRSPASRPTPGQPFALSDGTVLITQERGHGPQRPGVSILGAHAPARDIYRGVKAQTLTR